MAQVQRMSRLMIKTLRDDPADAETLNHKLLVRAGYVRRTAAGIWTWLPLGKKVLENITRVVREEMDAIGGQEVLLPALLPKESYDASGRYDEYGDLLFRLNTIEISLPSFQKGGLYLHVHDNPALTSVSLPQLTKLGEELSLVDNPRLTTVKVASQQKPAQVAAVELEHNGTSSFSNLHARES